MDYAELHCRTNFSFLCGASHPSELVERAAALRLSALAITDLSGFYGVVRAWQAAARIDDAPRLIYGSELELDPQHDGSRSTDALVLLATNGAGYAKISQLISTGRLRAAKGVIELRQAEICEAGGADVVVLAGGPRSRLLRLVQGGQQEAARAELGRLREAFGRALYLELNRHQRPGDRERSLALLELGRALDVPAVATNDVHFHLPQRKKLHDVLYCIRHTVTLQQAGRRLLPNAERHLKGATQMAALFADVPAVVRRSVEVAERCEFALQQLVYGYPPEAVPAEEDADAYLARLARRGLVDRLGPRRAAELGARLDKELCIIAQLGYAGYFLTMWEVVRFCQRQRILCQGRGSAANSLVCYAIGVTAVSPDQIDMLFERFVSLERHEPPDIDLDIEHDRREEVIQHVYRQYGRERAAMVAEVICYRQRSAVRDVGKVLGFSDEALLKVTQYTAGGGWGRVDDARMAGAAQIAGIDAESRRWKQLMLLSALLSEFPRHLSIHVGGFVLSRGPVAHIVPIENARMVDRTVIQWDKDDIDALGIFKVDLLGLGMLSVIARAFRLVSAHRGIDLDLASVPADDPETYEMIRRADTIGVFQIESRAQMGMLPRLQPKSFYDLVIEVALVRPGPIQGGMVHPYLRRRRGEEAVEYPHPKLRAILGRTLGVPIFQEQVMRIAVAVGGYTPGEADQLRRDIASWGRAGKMQRHQQRLYAAMRAEGINEAFAQRIIDQIEGFGSYGFPESHAASFAHLVYVSAYLKCHFPAEFTVALINAQPMGFYQVATLVADAYRHGVPILGVDVQHSDWEAQVVENRSAPRQGCGSVAIRLGLRSVRDLSEAAAARIVAQRECEGPFTSIAQLAARCQLSRKQLMALAFAGAFGGLMPARREAIWTAAALGGDGLVANLDAGEERVVFGPLSEAELMQLDYVYADSFVERHPMQVHRETLRRRGVRRAIDLVRCAPGSIVQVAGVVIVRQRPGGGKMIFMALEDETGLVDIAVYPGLFERYRPLIMLSSILLVRGELQLDGAARSVLARRFAQLSDDSCGRFRSRNFH